VPPMHNFSFVSEKTLRIERLKRVWGLMSNVKGVVVKVYV